MKYTKSKKSFKLGYYVQKIKYVQNFFKSFENIYVKIILFGEF